MARTIEWKQTGGKTHRVTVTSDEPVSPYANCLCSSLGLENAYLSEDWQSHVAQQEVANASPERMIAWGSPLDGLFGSWL